jgi:predicted XRE-type DNA-binding protein
MEGRKMKEKPLISTDNIFADLGLKNAEELRARSDLMSEVVSIIRNSNLSQKEIAAILGISAPKVSALMTGKINDFSNDTLVHYLTLLGCNVEIRLVPQRRVTSRAMKRGRIRVKRPALIRKRIKSKMFR